MLRKQENTDQLQLLQVKVKELEEEVNSLKASLKYNQHQQFGNSDNRPSRAMLATGKPKFSEEQFLGKLMKIVAGSQKHSVPNSFMR